jgi:hypothetical protein
LTGSWRLGGVLLLALDYQRLFLSLIILNFPKSPQTKNPLFFRFLFNWVSKKDGISQKDSPKLFIWTIQNNGHSEATGALLALQSLGTN